MPTAASPSSLSSHLLAAPPYVPEGWPVAIPELLMAYVDRVMAIRIGAAFGQPAFERYLHEWERSVEARPPGAGVFAMYDIPVWPGLTAVQRKAWAAMLQKHEETLRRTTRGMALAAQSALTRGASRAVFWLAPPPYPYAVVDTTRAAFDSIAQRGGPPAAAAHEEYEAIVRQRWVSA
jgi:hypothetical protein